MRKFKLIEKGQQRKRKPERLSPYALALRDTTTWPSVNCYICWGRLWYVRWHRWVCGNCHPPSEEVKPDDWQGLIDAERERWKGWKVGDPIRP